MNDSDGQANALRSGVACLTRRRFPSPRLPPHAILTGVARAAARYKVHISPS